MFLINYLIILTIQIPHLLSGDENICESPPIIREARLIVVNCSIHKTPAFGSIMYYEVTYRSKVFYDCGFTRKLVGNHEIECGKNGEWSGFTPRCVEMECNYPDLVYPHGKVKMLAGVRANDKIIYECDNGTITEVICLSQGIWLPSPPNCMTGNTSQINSTTTTTSANQHKTTIEPGNSSTVHPPKRNLFCKWKLFKWMCNLFN